MWRQEEGGLVIPVLYQSASFGGFVIGSLCSPTSPLPCRRAIIFDLELE